MRHPDDEREDTARAEAFLWVSTMHPNLLGVIRRLLAAGQTPTQIEQAILRFDLDPDEVETWAAVASMCFDAARHLQANPSA